MEFLFFLLQSIVNVWINFRDRGSSVEPLLTMIDHNDPSLQKFNSNQLNIFEKVAFKALMLLLKS